MRQCKDSVVEGQIRPTEVPERQHRTSRREEITKRIIQEKFLALSNI